MATATLTATVEGSAVWRAQPGSQALFLACPAWEVLYTGTRGPGKTDSLLMDFLQHVGKGLGPAWRGVIFRRAYKPLEEIVVKSRRWFSRIVPGARFLSSQADYKWVFPAGEELLLRNAHDPKQYWDYHGFEMPWIGWEELTAWPDGRLYHMMKSINRSSVPGVPRKYRATCNPYGPGHNWVKAYFIDPAPPGVPFVADAARVAEQLSELGITLEGSEGLMTATVHGHYSENRALMDAQPDYPGVIARSAENPEQAKAWLSDDWDIVAGGMFDDVWSRSVHVLAGVRAWRPSDTPVSWRIDRSFDWGATKPFSVGWWAESDGTIAPNREIYPRGTLIRIAEWYGWNGQPNVGLRLEDNAIATGIAEREKQLGIAGRVKPGPADTMIFTADPGRKTIANLMREAAPSVRFTEADKRPGSRKPGWRAVRQMLKAALDGDREQRWMLVMETCTQFIRTVPTLPRDEKDPDDVDTDAEDHCGDEARYRVVAPKREASTFEFRV